MTEKDKYNLKTRRKKAPNQIRTKSFFGLQLLVSEVESCLSKYKK